MSDITNRAMLSRLTITQWTARRTDEQITRQVAEQHQSDEAMGRYTKHLLDKKANKDIVKSANAARAFHYENTLPWHDDGHRILPSANYWNYTQGMHHHKKTFITAVDSFCNTYRQYVGEARLKLNNLYNASDYPSPGEIANRFSFSTSFMPIPLGNDFRVELSADQQNAIRADIEARTASAIQSATKDIWDRVYKAVSHLHERLTAYRNDPDTNAKTGVFRDTIILNIRELVALMPRLNMTGDPQLEKMRIRLERELCQEEPQTLRDSAPTRENIAHAAETIIQEMNGFMNLMAA